MKTEGRTPRPKGVPRPIGRSSGCPGSDRCPVLQGSYTIGEWAGKLDTSDRAGPATAVLRSYEAALNRGDVEAIRSLYAHDAVFMAQHRNPAVGEERIQTAYREILSMIRLDIRFEIDEVVVVSPTVAYARTRSIGTTTIVANDARVAEGNQELFVLVRPEDGGGWKIGRYIFSTTQPRG